MDIRCRWLDNGYVCVRSYASGFVGLYDPAADDMRGIPYAGMLDAARDFVAARRRIVSPAELMRMLAPPAR